MAVNFLSGFKNLTKKISGNKETTPEEKKIRNNLVKVGNQLTLTQKIILANTDTITELATDNAAVAELQEKMSSEQFQHFKELQAKLISGEEINAKEANKIVSFMEDVTAGLEDVGAVLEVPFNTVTSSIEELISNDKINQNDRRDMLKQLISVANNTEVGNDLNLQQLEALDELEKLNLDDINISGDQKDDIKKLVNQLGGDAASEAKMRGTLGELNTNMDSMVLTNQELNETLDKPTEDGESLKDMFTKGGLAEVGKTVKGGAIDFLLNQVGLGGLGLEEMISMKGMKSIGGKVKNIPGMMKAIPGAIAGGAGSVLAGGKGLLSGAGKMAGKAGKVGAGLLRGAGGLAKFAGPLGLALTAGMSAYDFYEGFSDPSKIAGLKEGEKASTGTKVQAGAASALSGLSFGLIDPETIYEGMEDVQDFIGDIFGEKGMFPMAGKILKGIMMYNPIGAITSLLLDFDGTVDYFFGKDSLFAKAGNILSGMWSKVSKFASGIFSDLEEGVDSFFGDDGMFSKITGFFDKIMSVISFDSITNLLDSNIFKTIEEGIEKVFGDDGIFGMAANFIKKIIGFTPAGMLFDMLGGAEGIKSDLGEMGTKVTDKAKNIGSAISGFFGFGDKEVDTVTKDVGSIVSNNKLTGRSATLMDKEAKIIRESREQIKKMANAASPTIIIPENKPANKAPSRDTNIDDLGLTLANSSLF